MISRRPIHNTAHWQCGTWDGCVNMGTVSHRFLYFSTYEFLEGERGTGFPSLTPSERPTPPPPALVPRTPRSRPVFSTLVAKRITIDTFPLSAKSPPLVSPKSYGRRHADRSRLIGCCHKRAPPRTCRRSTSHTLYSAPRWPGPHLCLERTLL